MVTRRDSQLLVFQDLFSFYIFRRPISLFSFSDSNTYLDTELSIISFALWWARNNVGVIFSFLYTAFVLFTSHVLVAYGCPRGYIFKFYFSQAFKFAELKLQLLLKELQLFYIV